jgi:hypothetical protein
MVELLLRLVDSLSEDSISNSTHHVKTTFTRNLSWNPVSNKEGLELQSERTYPEPSSEMRNDVGQLLPHNESLNPEAPAFYPSRIHSSLLSIHSSSSKIWLIFDFNPSYLLIFPWFFSLFLHGTSKFTDNDLFIKMNPRARNREEWNPYMAELERDIKCHYYHEIF